MKIIELNFTKDGSPLYEDAHLHCWRRKCDNCILRFQCLTMSHESVIMEIDTALKYLEGDDHWWLVWKDSNAQQTEGELQKCVNKWCLAPPDSLPIFSGQCVKI